MLVKCFIGAIFAEQNELKMRKTKEKLKLHLADGTKRVSNLIVERACVTFDEHAEFLDFFVIKLRKYEAIL